MLTPCSLDPALMRVIHRALISRFLWCLFLVACCSALYTRSRAILMTFLLRPRKPLANFKMRARLKPMAKYQRWDQSPCGV